jgi:hypothetical protein
MNDSSFEKLPPGVQEEVRPKAIALHQGIRTVARESLPPTRLCPTKEKHATKRHIKHKKHTATWAALTSFALFVPLCGRFPYREMGAS